MNATHFNSLAEFARNLGREGICRITEEDGKGIFISWIDNSPDALRRRDVTEKQTQAEKSSEQREQQDI
jgi:DNA/RNA-binding protein KIN17